MRLPVKRSTEVQTFFVDYDTAILAYLGTSKCWGHNILQTPALVCVGSSFCWFQFM